MPNCAMDFPTPLLQFFVAHSGIIVGVVFLMLTPAAAYPFSIVRVFAWAGCILL